MNARKLLSIVTLVCGSATLAYSAVLPVTDITIDPSGNLTSVEYGSNTSTDLQGATVVNANAGNERYWTTTDPGSETAALNGLVVTEGVLNTSNGTDFQLGPLGLTDVLFIFEYGFNGNSNFVNDDITIAAIDSLGNSIGDYTLSLIDFATDPAGPRGSGTYTGNLLGTGSVSRESGGTISNARLTGYTFTLGDFTGTTGDLSTATGITIVNNDPGLGVDNGGTGPIDIAAVGVVVPEPSAIALLGLALSTVLMLRRRSK